MLGGFSDAGRRSAARYGARDRAEKALKKAGRDLHDLGLLEVNEAYAAVALHATACSAAARATPC